MSEKKEYVVIVESRYTEQYFLQNVDEDEEITLELVSKKGQFEETLEFQGFVKIVDVEEMEDPEDVPGLVLNVTGVKQVFNEQEQ